MSITQGDQLVGLQCPLSKEEFKVNDFQKKAPSNEGANKFNEYHSRRSTRWLAVTVRALTVRDC